MRTVAVEPLESAVLSGKPPGPHKIQGIGAGFVPGNCDQCKTLYMSNMQAAAYTFTDLSLSAALLDEVVQVAGADAIKMARELAIQEVRVAAVFVPPPRS